MARYSGATLMWWPSHLVGRERADIWDDRKTVRYRLRSGLGTCVMEFPMANKKTGSDDPSEMAALIEMQTQIITSLTDTIVKLSQVIADATEPDEEPEPAKEE